jgi:hypothetical protein
MDTQIWNRRMLWISVLFPFLGTSPQAASADCADYTDYIHLRGRVNVIGSDVKVAGNYAYLGGNHKFYVVDISDPDAPAVADSTDVNDYVWKIDLDGGYAYLAEEGAGFQIVDITEPTSVTVVGTVDADSLGYVGAIMGIGQIAYVAATLPTPPQKGFLHIFDVSNPASPTLITSVELPPFPQGLDVVGTHAYVTTGSTLQIVDIGNPLSASLVGGVNVSSAAGTVTVRDEVAYVGNIRGVGGTGDGLYIVDVSNPAAPAVIDTVLIRDYEAALGTDLYVVNDTNLHVFDLANPATPALLGTINIPTGSSGSVAVSENFAYVTTFLGLQVIDVSNPRTIPPLGKAKVSGRSGSEIAVTGSLACVATDSSMSVIDTANPLAPILAGKVPSPCYDVAANGNLAYTVDGGSLNVVDLSTPTSPSVVGTVNVVGAFHLAVFESLACVTIGNALQIVNISDPNSPALLGSVAVPGAYDVAIFGEYACVTVADSGLKVVDISLPGSPVIVGSLDLASPIYRVIMAGHYAYIEGYPVQFGVVDLSTPTSPTLIGALAVGSGVPNGMAVEGLLAYVVDYTAGLQVVDLSIPSAPRILGGTLTPVGPGGALAVAVAGSFAYVTGSTMDDDPANFWVLPAQCSTPVSVVLSAFQAQALAEGIEVSWSTAEERERLGFHVYRSEHMGGPYDRLTSQLLMSAGTYTFLDRRVMSGETYFYKLEAVDRGGRSTFFGPVSARTGLASRNRLGMSRPNPFRGALAAIDFDLIVGGKTKLTILDVSGRRVRILVDEVLEQGAHTISWNGRNDRGESLPPGMYFYRLQAGSFSTTRSLVRLK